MELRKLTEEVLATNESSSIVMVSSEEVLPLQIEAYVKSRSEISWIFRQPSASAILHNQPYIELDLKFSLSQPDGTTMNQNVKPISQYEDGRLTHDGLKCYGRQLEGLPFLSKCVRTSVVTMNGASHTYRNSEYFVPFLRSVVGREAMAKIGTPWNDFADQPSYRARDNDNSPLIRGDARTMSPAKAKQARLFDLSMTLDGASQNIADANGTNAVTYTMTYREPLFMSIFNGLAGNEMFPVWCSEQNKSPIILHAQQTSINFNLHDNWTQNLFGLIQNDKDQALKVFDVQIQSARLCCKFVQPPSKYIAPALSANVSYQSTKFIRFRAQAPTGQVFSAPHWAKNAAYPSKVEFTLQASNFPYMPSCFMIEVAPDYNTKLNYIASGRDHATQRRNLKIVEASKEDMRWGIVALDLIVNTSPNVVPNKGSKEMTDQSIHNVRYNARQLYDLYLKNAASVERALYDFETWFNRGCTVLLTSADMNGILPSCHVRGNVSIQGKVTCVNTMPYMCYIGAGSPPVPGNEMAMGTVDGVAQGYSWIAGQKYEKFECQIVGVYSNGYMALDAKSGIIGEAVMSEQAGNALRLSSAM